MSDAERLADIRRRYQESGWIGHRDGEWLMSQASLVARQREALRNVTDAMKRWANDEDGLPIEAVEAWTEARTLARRGDRERSAMITADRLPSGYWHVRGLGPCNWSQPPLVAL